jgi:hypothetical protein
MLASIMKLAPAIFRTAASVDIKVGDKMYYFRFDPATGKVHESYQKRLWQSEEELTQRIDELLAEKNLVYISYINKAHNIGYTKLSNRDVQKLVQVLV